MQRWPRGAARAPLEDWARHFQLDPLLVRRIVQDQGLSLGDEPTDEEVDPNQTTNVMRIAELGEDVDDEEPEAAQTLEDRRED